MTNRTARRAQSRGAKASKTEAVLREAIRLQHAGRLADAERLYRRVLSASPDDANALHFLGLLRRRQHRGDEALVLIRRALELAPTYVDAWSNLGNLLKESERVDEAEHAYRRALALDARHAASWNNLGVVLRGRGLAEEAGRAFGEAIKLAPDDADAYSNLGNVFCDRGRNEDAVAMFRSAVALNPRHARANNGLGRLLYIGGNHNEAARVFERWQAADPAHPVPAHMLAACTGANVPARASDEYVRTTFDAFAGSFDDVLLHRLDYHAPDLLIEALAPVLGKPRTSLDVIDAGCGTGLCGPLLRPFARSLAGVDLSDGMLGKARERGVYDALHEEEITRFLAAHARSFDVIASADTLCYFGDLKDVTRFAREALRDGGWLAFSVEREDDEAVGYRIQPHGRYRHARSYVEQVLAQAKFESVDVAAAVLRRELGADVHGWIVRARASGAS